VRSPQPLAAAFLISLALPASAALAQAASGPIRPAGGHSRTAFIQGYDANRDGRVDRAEYDALREARFKAADADGDGVLTEDEYVAEYTGRLRSQYADASRPLDEMFERQLKQAVVRFSVIDRDRDGALTVEENQAVALRTFEEHDTDKDGVVSPEDPEPKPETDGDAAPAAPRS
jgi:EF hand